MTDEQAVEAHDGLAPNTVVGVNYYPDELTHREFSGYPRRHSPRRGRPVASPVQTRSSRPSQ